MNYHHNHPTSEPVVEMRDITKRYPGIIANNRIDFSLQKRQIHALLGENGAGKTTLMNILYGLVRPDGGRIFINGNMCEIASPSDAIRLGIGKVHQRPLLIDRLTIAENIFLGQQEHLSWRANDSGDNQKLMDLIGSYGFHLDPAAEVWSLSPGECQRVEILKSLYRKAEILILDEPTSVLTPTDCERLFELLNTMVQQGLSIIYISHKLEEVIEIADVATMLRDGEVIDTVSVGETTKQELACMMVGREVFLSVDKEPASPGKVVLEVSRLSVENDLGENKVRDVSFSVRCGEIFGIAGVSGSGQLELSEVLAGLRFPTSGNIKIEDDLVTSFSPREFMKKGIGFIPENISRFGVAEKRSIAENAMLKAYITDSSFLNKAFINSKKVLTHAEQIISKYDVRTPDARGSAGSLSGGNLHKLVLGREFSRNPKILIASQPTKGLDVAATEYIYRQLLKQRERGGAIVLISDNLDEVLQLSDTVAVMFEGKILAVIPSEDIDHKEIGLMIGGVVESNQFKNNIHDLA